MICCSIVCKEARTLKPNSLCLWYSFFSPNISHSLKQISHHQRALLLLKYKSPKHPHFSNYFNSLKFSFTLREKKKNHRLCTCINNTMTKEEKIYIYIHIRAFMYTHVHIHIIIILENSKSLFLKVLLLLHLSLWASNYTYA